MSLDGGNLKSKASICFSIFATLLGLVLSPTILSAEDATDDAEKPGRSLVSDLGRPASISLYNPIPGFWDELMKLDNGNGNIRLPEKGWQPFHEADMWIFFVDEIDDLNILGHYFDDVRSAIFPSENAGTHGVQITLSDPNPRKVYISYVLLSKYSDERSMQALACRLASGAYGDLVGYSNKKRRENFQTCKDKFDG